MPVGILPNLNEVVLLQLNGVLTPEEFNKAISLAFSAAEHIYKIAKEALYLKYLKMAEEAR